MHMSDASEQRLEQAVSYLREKSNDGLMARLYQKILFLLELKYYQKHSQYFIGIHFTSYKYGPFSKGVAEALESTEKIPCPKNVQEEIDAILHEYSLEQFDKETMHEAYQKMIDYIHSLVFYNITPFRASLDFNQYAEEDLLNTIQSKLDGQELESEKASFAMIRQEAKQCEHLFQT